MENVQQTEETTTEINVDGGWVVTHHILTRTWDTRTAITSFQDVVQEKRDALERAQQELAKAEETAAAIGATPDTLE